MAQPKYKLSRARTRKRRSHQALSAPNAIKCRNCGSPTLPHRLCLTCGTYKGRQVIAFDVDDEE